MSGALQRMEWAGHWAGVLWVSPLWLVRTIGAGGAHAQTVCGGASPAARRSNGENRRMSAAAPKDFEAAAPGSDAQS